MALSLKSILQENVQNRINLMRLTTLIEKVVCHLSATQAKTLTECFAEVSMLATNLNTLKYTQFNVNEWQLLIAATFVKLNELRSEVVEIAKSKKDVDFGPLLKALDEACNY
jgi:hypothetical protein